MAAGENTVTGVPASHVDVPIGPGGAEAHHVPGGHAEVLDGPFTTRQLLRIDEALLAADSATGLTFSVYVGDLSEPTQEHALRLHEQIRDSEDAVLIAVSPNQRVVEIVTGERARRRLPDKYCGLAAMSMTAAFGGGDLAGGVVTGLRMLADQVVGRH